MGKVYIIVEGKGDEVAAPNLVSRLWIDLGLPHQQAWAAIKWGDVRTKRDCDRALLIRDDEDGCPKTTGRQVADWIRPANLPFAIAVTLMFPEYEVLFLPCLHLMAGKLLDATGAKARGGIAAGTTQRRDFEKNRDVKAILKECWAGSPSRTYKETTDQLALTQMIDFPTLRTSNLPCFGTLERSLQWLATALPGQVRP